MPDENKEPPASPTTENPKPPMPKPPEPDPMTLPDSYKGDTKPGYTSADQVQKKPRVKKSPERKSKKKP